VRSKRKRTLVLTLTLTLTLTLILTLTLTLTLGGGFFSRDSIGKRGARTQLYNLGIKSDKIHLQGVIVVNLLCITKELNAFIN